MTTIKRCLEDKVVSVGNQLGITSSSAAWKPMFTPCQWHCHQYQMPAMALLWVRLSWWSNPDECISAAGKSQIKMMIKQVVLSRKLSSWQLEHCRLNDVPERGWTFLLREFWCRFYKSCWAFWFLRSNLVDLIVRGLILIEFLPVVILDL